MSDYLNIVQDVRRQIGLAEVMLKTDYQAARDYADKIMLRAKVSDCGRSADKQRAHASDLAEAFLHESFGE